MLKQATEAWNPAAKLPLERWLVKSQTDLDRERLTAIGNVVMPRVARFAVHLLGHELLAEK